MANHRPITPPPELVRQWLRERPEGEHAHTYIATQAAQWGADQEFEASVAWLDKYGIGWIGLKKFRNARRPKPNQPTTLKERIAAAITAGDEHTALSLLNEALPNG
jgi:hypothetical protein